LKLADELKDILRRTREALWCNFDQQDPRFITLKEELERLFKKKKLSEVTQDEMITNIGILNEIHRYIKELNRQNNQLRHKYNGDAKYARIHKRLQEYHGQQNGITDVESKIYSALMGIKRDADEKVLNNSQIMNNEAYFELNIMPLVIRHFKNEQKIPIDAAASRYINQLVVREYMQEYNTGLQVG
jgi:type I restriction enzyme R subunit